MFSSWCKNISSIEQIINNNKNKKIDLNYYYDNNYLNETITILKCQNLDYVKFINKYNNIKFKKNNVDINDNDNNKNNHSKKISNNYKSFKNNNNLYKISSDRSINLLDNLLGISCATSNVNKNKIFTSNKNQISNNNININNEHLWSKEEIIFKQLYDYEIDKLKKTKSYNFNGNYIQNKNEIKRVMINFFSQQDNTFALKNIKNKIVNANGNFIQPNIKQIKLTNLDFIKRKLNKLNSIVESTERSKSISNLILNNNNTMPFLISNNNNNKNNSNNQMRKISFISKNSKYYSKILSNRNS